MATTTAISGQPQKNNGASVLHAGNIDGVNVTNNLSLATNAHDVPWATDLVYLAVSPVSSGNVGNMKPLSAGIFNKMEEAQYVAKIIGTRIAQTDDTFLRSGAAETNDRTSLHYSRGYRQYDVSSWDYVTGAATLGGSEGTAITFHDPVAGTTIAVEPFPTDSVPGELVYRDGSASPTQDDYKARTNP